MKDRRSLVVRIVAIALVALLVIGVIAGAISTLT